MGELQNHEFYSIPSFRQSLTMCQCEVFAMVQKPLLVTVSEPLLVTVSKPLLVTVSETLLVTLPEPEWLPKQWIL